VFAAHYPASLVGGEGASWDDDVKAEAKLA
jgi:hypothetical protein